MGVPGSKKVLMLVTTAFEPDPRVYREALSLQSHGYQVTVVAWDREARLPSLERYDGVTVWRYRRKAKVGGRFRQLGGFLGFFRYAWKKLCQDKYDILHCHDLDTMPVGLAARLKGIKVVFDAHEADYYNLYPPPFPTLFEVLERLSARCADGVALTVGVQWQKYGGWHISRAVQLRNVPPRSFAERAALERRDDERPFTVGRIGFIKKGVGIEELFEALARLRHDGYEVEGLLAGKLHPDIRAEFEERLARAPYVRYVGSVPYPEVPRYYAKLHVAVAVYTRWEEHRYITPTKLLECLACGVPVIANPVGDVAQLAEKYGGIVLVEEPTAEALTEALRSLLSEPSRLQRLREEVARTRGEFTWETMEERLLTLYAEVLKS
jgi:glycosyltransferase involved in cell wall biosynthesis